jgi:Type II CAAX prenyl endopeptidase Rce1-like
MSSCVNAEPRPPASPLRLWLALEGLCGLGYALALPYLLPVLRGALAKAGAAAPSLTVLFLAQSLQLLVVCGVASWAGVWAAPRAGLDAPLLRARLAGEPVARRLGALGPRALGYGTLGSLAVLGLNLELAGWLPPALRLGAQGLEGTSRLTAALVGASSAFYGGVVEEVLMRWGLLSLLMLAALRLGLRRPAAFWVANVVSALLFGAGHLPVVLQLGAVTPVAVAYVVVANSLVGLLCGLLFFRQGLEQAILAHAWADVALHALPLLVV